MSKELGVAVETFQSYAEHELVGRVQLRSLDGAKRNPGQRRLTRIPA